MENQSLVFMLQVIIISGERNLIATAFALGQEAGLSASDSLRKWHYPKD